MARTKQTARKAAGGKGGPREAVHGVVRAVADGVDGASRWVRQRAGFVLV